MFRYGKIAIGCSLSSALYCFYNQIPMIYVERRKVHPFEFFKPDTDLSLLKIEPLRYDLKMSDEGVAVFGPSKRQVYEKIMVLLSLSGLVPFSNLAKSVHIEKKHLKIITERNRVYEVAYEELIVFDDTNISGLSSIPKDNKDEIYTVLQVESMERMQEMVNLPSMVKLRTEAGVDLETQKFIMLEGGN